MLGGVVLSKLILSLWISSEEANQIYRIVNLIRLLPTPSVKIFDFALGVALWNRTIIFMTLEFHHRLVQADFRNSGLSNLLKLLTAKTSTNSDLVMCEKFLLWHRSLIYLRSCRRFGQSFKWGVVNHWGQTDCFTKICTGEFVTWDKLFGKSYGLDFCEKFN